MPRRGDRQKKQHSCYRLERTPTPPQARYPKVRDRRAGKEDGRNQSLGQRGQAERRPRQVDARWLAEFEIGEQVVQRKQQQQAEYRFRNDESGEQKRPDGSEHAQPGIQSAQIHASHARPSMASAFGRCVEKALCPATR